MSCLIILIFNEQGAYAKIFPVPPDNETSLIEKNVPATPVHKHVYRHATHAHKLDYKHDYKFTHKHAHYAKKHRSHSKPRGTLTVSYALPATACCGETWEMYPTDQAQPWGNFTKGTQVTFDISPDDLIYSETNLD